MFYVILLMILFFIIGYLIGSLNFSIIIGKFYGIEIRNHGSGNAGMTNTLRTLGKIPAVLVTLGDVLKGVFACILAYYLGKFALNSFIPDFNSLVINNLSIEPYFDFLISAGLGAILGHNWPIYFNFKGGKGVLTTFAVILTIDYRLGLLLLLVFLIVVIISKYVSLASIISAISLPILYLFTNSNYKSYIEFTSGYLNIVFLFYVLVGSIVIIKHIPNIKRLLSGTENKLTFKKTVKKGDV